MSADVAVWWWVGGIPVEYKLSADLMEELYLGDEDKLTEVPPLVDDEALAAPAEEDGEELKPGL